MASNAHKPRSMPTGQRNVIRANDSPSLWNCTYSPGWTRDEAEILRKAVMKFGIGNWAKIVDWGCLPGKTIAQMNLQLQRLLGQQSTAEFAGLHLDPMVIGASNAGKQGSSIRRKNNCIVNTGNKLSREEIRRRIQQHRVAYELLPEEWQAIELPKREDPLVALESKRQELSQFQMELEQVLIEITAIRSRLQSRDASDKCTVNIAAAAAAVDEDQQPPKRAKIN